MIIDLTSTTSSEIASALLKARRNAGSPAMGMIGTIVVVVDEASHHDAMKAANEAGREHPSRVLVAILRPGRGASGLDAEVRVGEGIPGEAVLLRLHGDLAKQPQSVITPLLLPDSPVIVWWPGGGPKNPNEDPLGGLGRRRVTDAAASRRTSSELAARAEGYAPGDTDFAWTRLTPWRALMAAALDQHPAKITGAEVASTKGNPSADLMAAWLQSRLHVPVEQKASRGPGITAVRLFTPAGPIALTRPDGVVATFSIPGQPDRPVALKRRNTAELLSEELRRLDPDDVYARTLSCLAERQKMPAAAKKLDPEDRRSVQGSMAKAASETAAAGTARVASAELEAKADGQAENPKKSPGRRHRPRRHPPRRPRARKSTARKSTGSSGLRFVGFGLVRFGRRRVGLVGFWVVGFCGVGFCGEEDRHQEGRGAEEHDRTNGRAVVSEPSILVSQDADGLAHAVAARFITRLADVQSTGAVARVVLTGGRVASAMYRAVAESPARSVVDWQQVEYWWGDERFLPAGDPDRNETQVREALLDAVGADPANVHPMPADTGQGAEAAATAYAEELVAAAGTEGSAGVPTFDVLLLGVGPDGHVASLFPGNPGLREQERTVVAVHDAPKPPPTRLSLTFPALARAQEVWFVVAGADKAEAVDLALSGGHEVPAAKPRGLGQTLWLIDEAAAKDLSSAVRGLRR
jgi:glucose-6-phosphate dehydrogenase assembly protein OpcA